MEQTDRDREEAAFCQAASDLYQMIRDRHGALVNFLETTDGSLEIHISGTKEVTIGYRDAGDGRRPAMSIRFEPLKK